MADASAVESIAFVVLPEGQTTAFTRIERSWAPLELVANRRLDTGGALEGMTSRGEFGQLSIDDVGRAELTGAKGPFGGSQEQRSPVVRQGRPQAKAGLVQSFELTRDDLMGQGSAGAEGGLGCLQHHLGR